MWFKTPFSHTGISHSMGRICNRPLTLRGRTPKQNTKCNDSMAFPIVILNSFQDLWADKDKKRLVVKHKCRLAVRCRNKFSMTPSTPSSWTCFRICERTMTSKACGETQVKAPDETQVKTRGEMLKQVQHDPKHNVILNSFQDLWADKDKWRLAVRCWNKFSMTFNSAWQFNDWKTMPKEMTTNVTETTQIGKSPPRL